MRVTDRDSDDLGLCLPGAHDYHVVLYRAALVWVAKLAKKRRLGRQSPGLSDAELDEALGETTITPAWKRSRKAC